MPESLADLEQQRRNIFQRMMELSDFRSGSITATYAWHRGWARAAKQVVLGDGAEWIWIQADLHFPGAIQIVDLFGFRSAQYFIAAIYHCCARPATLGMLITLFGECQK
jgi:hypothetical protein